MNPNVFPNRKKKRRHLTMVEILKTPAVDLLSLSLDILKVSIQYILKGDFFARLQPSTVPSMARSS